MGNITFSFKGQKWNVEADDSEIQRAMIAFMEQKTLPFVGNVPENKQNSFAEAFRKALTHPAMLTNIPSYEDIISFIKTLPRYEFSKKTLEQHFIPDVEKRESLKKMLKREYHQTWNNNIRYAMKKIAKQEQGRWKLISINGKLITRVFEKS